MNRQQKTCAEEQYKLILECRSSGLTDYQWCKEHGINPGTFYNWVKRLREKACYDIPKATGRDNYKPQVTQDVVPLLILDEESEVPSVSNVDQNARIIANDPISVAELSCNGLTIRITNDINTRLLSQIFELMGGRAC